MKYDVIVIGGGISGLTSAAYLTRAGLKVLLCEKENKVGGLVNSFQYKGFTFDGGIRAIENSGMVFPMLRQLGIDVEFVKNDVSIGIEEQIIKFNSIESLEDYKKLLNNKFPDNTKDIENIIWEIKKIIKYMDILYGIDNPVFLDLKNDKEYIYKTILPWMFKFMTTINKINKLNTPVNEYLGRFTKNEKLIDMIAQHFFKDTPTFFALGYFSLYIDYKYPKGGTGTLIEKLEKFILDNKGEIKTNINIEGIDIENKILKDSHGDEYNYEKIIWAADLSRFYNSIEMTSINEVKVRKRVEMIKNNLKDKIGGDSVLSVYITVDLHKDYFENICTEHFFYTPHKNGLNSIELSESHKGVLTKEGIKKWLKEFLELTTYEISIPVMRDRDLALEGKSGLIISTLLDYDVVKQVNDEGWYEEFKNISAEYVLNVLSDSVFKGLKESVIDKFVATPRTIERITGNLHGAITGWAFTNKNIPVESKMIRVAKAVDTPIKDIYQAGQWTFSPSGLPISILTGRLAAKKISK